MALPRVLENMTIENRSGEIADNVRKNNALFAKLKKKKKGRIKTFSGGSQIFRLRMWLRSIGSWLTGRARL